VAFVVTYGDPGFYGKVGFQAVSEDTVQAPIEVGVTPLPRTVIGLSLKPDLELG
jgi:predicted N-acetyltransferase YhbS